MSLGGGAGVGGWARYSKVNIMHNVTRSIDVTSARSSFLTVGHETKEFHQIKLNYGVI